MAERKIHECDFCGSQFDEPLYSIALKDPQSRTIEEKDLCGECFNPPSNSSNIFPEVELDPIEGIIHRGSNSRNTRASGRGDGRNPITKFFDFLDRLLFGPRE